MNYTVLYKKRNRIYIWSAADRNREKIVDFEVSQSLNVLAYEKIKISQYHVIGKSDTCFVESMNAKEHSLEQTE